MKKVIFAIAIVTAFAACNNATTEAPAADSTKVDTAAAAKIDTAAAKVDTAAAKVDSAAAKVDSAAKK